MYVASFVVFLVFSILYSIILTTWCVNWYRHRLSTKGIPLHTYIGVTLLLELLYHISGSLFYTATDIEGYGGSFSYAVLAYGLLILSKVIFQSLLILIGLGWCIVIHSLPINHAIGIAIFVVCKLMIRIGNLNVFRKPLGEQFWLANIFFDLFVNLGILILVLFVTMNNIRKLTKEVNDAKAEEDVVDKNTSSPSSIPLQSFPSDSQAQVQSQAHESQVNGEREGQENKSQEEQAREHNEREQEEREQEDPVDHFHIPEAEEKLKLFRLFYKFYVGYMIATALIGFIGNQNTIEYAESLVDFVFLTGLCCVFRLRDTNQYFYLVGEDDTSIA